MTTAQDGGKIISPTHRPPLPPQEMLPVLISVRGCVDPRAILRPEGFYVNGKLQWHYLESNKLTGSSMVDFTVLLCLVSIIIPILSCYFVGEFTRNWRQAAICFRTCRPSLSVSLSLSLSLSALEVKFKTAALKYQSFCTQEFSWQTLALTFTPSPTTPARTARCHLA